MEASLYLNKGLLACLLACLLASAKMWNRDRKIFTQSSCIKDFLIFIAVSIIPVLLHRYK